MNHRKMAMGISITLAMTCFLMSLESEARDTSIPCYGCVDCTQKLTGSDKNVYLYGNVQDNNNKASEACIVISGNNNSFNGNNKTINGIVSRKYGILVTGNFAEVSNVTVKNFGNPSETDSDPNNQTPWMTPTTGQVVFRNSSYSTAYKVRAEGGRNGIVFYARDGGVSTENEILECYATDAGWMGMALWFGTSSSVIRRSKGENNNHAFSLCTAGTDDNRIISSDAWYSWHWNVCICNTNGSDMRLDLNEMRDADLAPYPIPNVWGERVDIRNEIGIRAYGVSNTCNPDKVYNWRDLNRYSPPPEVVAVP